MVAHSPPRRFISLQVKITVMSALLVLVSLKIVGMLSYQRILSSNIEPLLGKRLDYSARGIALTIPGEKYRKIITTFLQSPQKLNALPEFEEIHQFLVISQRQNELAAEVRTLIKDPLHPDQMIALVTSGESGIKYFPLNPWVARVFKEGLPVFTPIQSKNGGIWISGLAPIETKNGDITGVIQVDYEASQEVALATADILKTLVTAGAIGFALALIMGVFLGRALSRPVKNLTAAALEVMKGNLNPTITITTRDEIGTLASIFKNMLAELRTNRQSLEDYSKNLETKVRERTHELKESNQKTAAMLDSLGQGFFLFQADGKCLSIHSKACLELLEGTPEGKSLGEYLKIDLAGGVDDWVNALFSEPLPFESLSPLGIKHYAHSNGLIIELSYQPIRDEEGAVKWVVAVATDKTAEVQAHVEAESEKARSRQILLIAKNRNQFLTFMREMKQLLQDAETLLSEESPVFISEFLRGLHTIKGGAALFRMQSLRDLAHQKEADVSLITAKPTLQSSDWLLLSGVIASIRNKLEESLLELRPLFGESLNLGIKRYDHLEPTLMELLQQARSSGIQTTLVESWERTLLHESVINGFSHFNEIISQAAEILGKKISPIVFEGGELKVYLKAYEGLISSLVHAFRNAVDHGIELPEKRLAVGKTETGEIRVIFQRSESISENPLLQILIIDDGDGINAAKIREILKRKNPAHPLLKAEDSEVYQVLFESGFSTKAEVTDLSGRGVGLDAILYEAKRLKGSARLDSRPGRETILTIQVPLLSAFYLDLTED